ncbi:MAG: hypothetical protein EHJ95_04480 [Methanobacteriota archaeon]|nr:MAG: hypothetical protein EHJ95_04480 [Euryarchaeota archaeon]
MFEPKVYKKNGLDAFRLVGSDGSEFFYEGAIDCDESELYKDAVGRLYYSVTSRVGGPVKYYVELDPQVPQIPVAGEGKKEKDTSRLINASPREGASLPDDIYVVPEATQADTPVETTPERVAESIFDRIHKKAPEQPEAMPLPVQDESPVMKPEASEAMPLPAQEESPVMKPEASEAIHAVFSPKADISHPPAGQPEKAALDEKYVPPGGTKKKRSLKWPAAIAIVIVLIAFITAGVYVVKPGAFDGLRSLYAHPTATPQPTPVPTAEPTPTPTPVPTAAPDQTTTLADIAGLIDPENSLVMAFARAHTDATSDGDMVMQACDLFSYVNGRWNYSDNYTQPRRAGEIIGSLEGTQKDYTILMSALMQSINVESRVIFSYNGDLLRYYPEVFASNMSAGYSAAVQKLNTRYGVTSPQGHADDTGYWISLSIGDVPGIRPEGATLEYALYNGEISPIKTG